MLKFGGEDAGGGEYRRLNSSISTLFTARKLICVKTLHIVKALMFFSKEREVATEGPCRNI